jgi:hypothetical protein
MDMRKAKTFTIGCGSGLDVPSDGNTKVAFVDATPEQACVLLLVFAMIAETENEARGLVEQAAAIMVRMMHQGADGSAVRAVWEESERIISGGPAALKAYADGVGSQTLTIPKGAIPQTYAESVASALMAPRTGKGN